VARLLGVRASARDRRRELSRPRPTATGRTCSPAIRCRPLGANGAALSAARITSGSSSRMPRPAGIAAWRFVTAGSLHACSSDRDPWPARVVLWRSSFAAGPFRLRRGSGFSREARERQRGSRRDHLLVLLRRKDDAARSDSLRAPYVDARDRRDASRRDELRLVPARARRFAPRRSGWD
jgi:hypothetical protein